MERIGHFLQKVQAAGIEPATICVLGRCDNHYTTLASCKYENIILFIPVILHSLLYNLILVYITFIIYNILYSFIWISL